MGIYDDTDLPIRDELAAAHQQTLDSFTAPGRWWTGAERAAIVAESREARADAGLQCACPGGTEAPLPETVREVVRTVAVSTNALDRSFCDDALAAGLTDGEYCETVGLVSRAVNMDVFARGIGIPPRPLGAARPGEPSRRRPQTATDEGAWIATIPGGRRGKQDAIDTYGTNAVEGAPFIYRALSLVPEEAQGLIALGGAQYVKIGNFMDLDFSYEPEITRVQVELLAARVSAINECFY